jgi:ELWxxDGT repeat protein
MDNNLGQVVLIKDINPSFYNSYHSPSDYPSTYSIYPDDSYPSGLLEFKGKVYFTANEGKNGNELFVSDGTAEGTRLAANLNPGENIRFFDGLGKFKDKLYFKANDGIHGVGLFVSDGTPEGTQLAAVLDPKKRNDGSGRGSAPDNFVEFNDKLYFTADDGVHGDELFVSDGTPEGTRLAVDLYPGEDRYGYINSSFPMNFVESNDKLYFTADDGVHGNELFVSDGTAEGTQLVADIRPGANKYGKLSSFADNFVEFNGKLYFTADDGVHGDELFVSDGTTEGTQLMTDLYPGKNSYGFAYSSYPDNFVEFNGKLYFTANDGVHGDELFVSDGTPEGTQLVTDLYPGENSYGSINSSAPDSLVEFNGKLYFAADDGENGRELFVSDGTPEGTQLAADIRPGKTNDGIYSYSSSPSELTVVGNELFFSADISQTGRELFKLTFDNSSIDATPILISGSEESDNLLGGDRAEQIQALNGNDTVVSCGGNDYIDGGDGNDRLISNTGIDNLMGANGNDTLSSGNGNDKLWGGNGNDILRGRRGDDILMGGDDRDLLDGGIGNDILRGRDGDDIFVLKSGAGSDRILDFNSPFYLGTDRLGLADGLQFEDLSFADHNILLGAEVLATLNEIDTEKLTSDDFKKL